MRTGSRERILARIRQLQGRGGTRPSQAELEAVGTCLRAHPRGTLPPVGLDLVARFRARGSDAGHHRGGRRKSTGPVAIARYLKASNLPLTGCVWPQLARPGWKSAGLALEPREANGSDAIGVTGAFSAIAETGTLMFSSGPDTPSTVSLLPETHVAVLEARRIVAHMEDAWDLAPADFGQLPRAINFVSGHSRTDDIDQTIVMGAHGPYRVHIVVVRD